MGEERTTSGLAEELLPQECLHESEVVEAEDGSFFFLQIYKGFNLYAKMEILWDF